MSRNTAVQAALSVKEVQEFCRRVAGLKNPTLARIKDLGAEFGITMSLMAARTFREGLFAEHLDRLRRAREQTEQIMAIAAEGHDPLAAAMAMAKQELLDELTSGRDVDLKKVSAILLNLARSGATQKESEIRAREYERKLAEHEGKKKALQSEITRAKKKGRGGLTKEALEEIEAQIGLL